MPQIKQNLKVKSISKTKRPWSFVFYNQMCACTKKSQNGQTDKAFFCDISHGSIEGMLIACQNLDLDSYTDLIKQSHLLWIISFIY